MQTLDRNVVLTFIYVTATFLLSVCIPYNTVIHVELAINNSFLAESCFIVICVCVLYVAVLVIVLVVVQIKPPLLVCYIPS